ncbi:MAG: hypothetical protein EBS35_06110, partial [Bacteroidetes bacterium]|nr:hypothetical protein [Bacteroidota bacterium]
YLLESLFVGVPFDFGIHTYSDDLQGYAIKCESIPSSAFLLSRVMKDSRFFFGPNSDGSLDIRTAIAKKYMLEYEEAVEILCALTHLCSGMPARATELCSLRFNTRMSERNLFWLGEQIMTVTRKNKRNNLTGITNCINRFFPKELSKLVSAFIIFVNPVYSFFATNVYGLSVSGSVTSNLFVRKGRPYTPEFCRSVFVDMLFKYGQLTCSFGNYRHVVNHFVKNVILFKFHHVSDDSTFGEKDGEDLIEDLQLGHSRRTANMAYSINSEERIGRQYIVNEYRSLSSKWVEFLNSSTAPFSIRSSESIVSDEKETCCSSIPVADPESNNFNDEIFLSVYFISIYSY